MGIREAPFGRLAARYRLLAAKKRFERIEQLLETQWDMALSGKNPAMAIWAGKNYAGQTDRSDVTSAGAPLKIIVEKY
jgi:hypothetical protein